MKLIAARAVAPPNCCRAGVDISSLHPYLPVKDAILCAMAETEVRQIHALPARRLAHGIAGKPPAVSLRDILADLKALHCNDLNWRYLPGPMVNLRAGGGSACVRNADRE